MTEVEFREFYGATAKPLKAYLSRITGNATLADDLLQESYYRMLRVDLPSMDPSQLKSYLYRTATNLARDHFRATKFQPAPLNEATAGEAASSDIGLSADIQQVLNEIKPNERQLVWLAYVEGASHREIAEMTGVKEASVRPLLFRAKQKLASILRERGLAVERSAR